MNKADKIKEANLKHHLDLTDADTHPFDGNLYISSQKAAQLLNVSYHSFSNDYVIPLTKTVRCIRSGRSSWYSINDLEALMHKVIETNKSILDVCKED